jgi:hypothetical protein
MSRNQIQCEKCKRRWPLSKAQGWHVKVYPGEGRFYTCPRCTSKARRAKSMPLNGSQSFMYDPVTDSILTRPMKPGAEINCFHCACGWILAAAGKDYMVGIAKHRRECPEGARQINVPKAGGGDAK